MVQWGDRFQSTHPVWGATTVKISVTKPNIPFQSTHPVWGATSSPWRASSRGLCFNPRTPCGVRQQVFLRGNIRLCVSIHAPRVGCDITAGDVDSLSFLFQSTHPVWGATAVVFEDLPFVGVSIHAPRVGCDGHSMLVLIPNSLFQSTHPVWGATPAPGASGPRLPCFNPRTPCGVRRISPVTPAK